MDEYNSDDSLEKFERRLSQTSDTAAVCIAYGPSWVKGRLRYNYLRVGIWIEHLRKKNVELDVRQLEVPSLEGRVPIHDRNIGVMRMLIYDNTAYELPIKDLPVAPDDEHPHYLEMLMLLVASFGPL